jgi:hypothetical protein
MNSMPTIPRKSYNSHNAGFGETHLSCREDESLDKRCFCGYVPKGTLPHEAEVTCAVCASFIGQPCPSGCGKIVQ